jgi:hypothetical protein
MLVIRLFDCVGLEIEIVDKDGTEGIHSFSPQLLETLEQLADQKLESLNLSSKGLSWLPESVGLLTNLTSLDLSGNNATKQVPLLYPVGMDGRM